MPAELESSFDDNGHHNYREQLSRMRQAMKDLDRRDDEVHQNTSGGTTGTAQVGGNLPSVEGKKLDRSTVDTTITKINKNSGTPVSEREATGGRETTNNLVNLMKAKKGAARGDAQAIRCRVLEATVETSRRRIAELEEKLKYALEENDCMRNKVGAETASNLAMKKNLEATTQKLEERREQCDELILQLQELDQLVSELQDSEASTKISLQNVQEELEEVVSNAKKNQQAAESLKIKFIEEIKRWKEKNGSLYQSNLKLMEETESLMDERDGLVDKNDVKEAKILRLTNHVSEWKSRHHDAKDLIEKLRSELAERRRHDKDEITREMERQAETAETLITDPLKVTTTGLPAPDQDKSGDDNDGVVNQKAARSPRKKSASGTTEEQHASSPKSGDGKNGSFVNQKAARSPRKKSASTTTEELHASSPKSVDGKNGVMKVRCPLKRVAPSTASTTEEHVSQKGEEKGVVKACSLLQASKVTPLVRDKKCEKLAPSTATKIEEHASQKGDDDGVIKARSLLPAGKVMPHARHKKCGDLPKPNEARGRRHCNDDDDDGSSSSSDVDNGNTKQSIPSPNTSSDYGSEESIDEEWSLPSDIDKQGGGGMWPTIFD